MMCPSSPMPSLILQLDLPKEHCNTSKLMCHSADVSALCFYSRPLAIPFISSNPHNIHLAVYLIDVTASNIWTLKYIKRYNALSLFEYHTPFLTSQTFPYITNFINVHFAIYLDINFIKNWIIWKAQFIKAYILFSFYTYYLQFYFFTLHILFYSFILNFITPSIRWPLQYIKGHFLFHFLSASITWIHSLSCHRPSHL